MREARPVVLMSNELRCFSGVILTPCTRLFSPSPNVRSVLPSGRRASIVLGSSPLQTIVRFQERGRQNRGEGLFDFIEVVKKIEVIGLHV
jgi:hypothetical protein